MATEHFALVWWLFSLGLCQVMIREDILVPERNSLDLSLQESRFVQDPCHAVHFNQILYILLFAQPVHCQLDLLLLLVGPVEPSPSIQAAGKATAEAIHCPEEEVSEIIASKFSSFSNLCPELLCRKVSRERAH